MARHATPRLGPPLTPPALNSVRVPKMPLADLTYAAILQALYDNRGSQMLAAKALGLKRHALGRYMRKLGIDGEAIRRATRREDVEVVAAMAS